jgi:protein TonB
VALYRLAFCTAVVSRWGREGRAGSRADQRSLAGRGAAARGLDRETRRMHLVLRSKMDAEGQATHVSVITDPGHGFGAAAVACAMREKYQPARDANGRTVADETKPFRVRFER